MLSHSPAVRKIDHFELVEDLKVGGANEKDILRDPESGHVYIAKLGDRNSDLEVVTEYLIHLIGRSLQGVLVADAMLGLYKGQLRFLSRYFLDGKADQLVHGLELFSELFDSSTVHSVVKRTPNEQAMFTVQSVHSAFGAHYTEYGTQAVERLFSGFVAMLTHDALIGVQDRHHENWGIVVRRELAGAEPKFAPLFDSARGLFCNHLDRQLGPKYLHPGCDAAIDHYVQRSTPMVGFKGHPARVIRHHQLLACVFRDYPAQRPNIAAILESYDFRRVREDISRELGPLCCPQRRTLILVCLRRRLKVLWRALTGEKP